MPQVVITPWRDNSELIQVRAQFYPSAESNDPDMRRKATSLVAAWKLRGNLPHTVESTALLTDAVLNDDPAKAFVTGLVDSNQSGVWKKSMFRAAKHIGLPASFVELRHQATHEELPALLVLRQAATRSLGWLWEYYWRSIDIRSGALDDDDEAFADGVLKLKQRFRHILRSYLEARLDAVKEKGPAPSRDGFADACQQCVQICKGGEATIKVLAAVFLESEFLVPTSKTLGSSMESEFPLWDDLLKKLTLHQRPFLHILTDEMSIMIVQPSRLDISIDTYREGVYMWLVHVITAEGWATSRKRGAFNASCVISTCLMNPNHWSRRLATVLAVDTNDEFLKAQWANLVKVSNSQYERYQLDGLNQMEITNIKEEVNRVNAEINNFEQHANSASQGSGWVKWQGPWVPKPIGMI